MSNTRIDKAHIDFNPINGENINIKFGNEKFEFKSLRETGKVTLPDGRKVAGFEASNRIFYFKELTNGKIRLVIRARNNNTDLGAGELTVIKGSLSGVRQVVTNKKGKITATHRFRTADFNEQSGPLDLNNTIVKQPKLNPDGTNQHGVYQLQSYTRSEWVRELFELEREELKEVAAGTGTKSLNGPKDYNLSRDNIENAHKDIKNELKKLIKEFKTAKKELQKLDPTDTKNATKSQDISNKIKAASDKIATLLEKINTDKLEDEPDLVVG